MCESCECRTCQARERMSQAQAVLGDVAKGKVSNAISALHGIRWAAGYAQSEDDIDAFLCLLDAVLPRVGAELEIVHSALGGTPVGYFAHAKRGDDDARQV